MRNDKQRRHRRKQILAYKSKKAKKQKLEAEFGVLTDSASAMIAANYQSLKGKEIKGTGQDGRVKKSDVELILNA